MNSIFNDTETMSRFPPEQMRKLERYCKNSSTRAKFPKAHLDSIQRALSQYLSSVAAGREIHASKFRANCHQDEVKCNSSYVHCTTSPSSEISVNSSEFRETSEMTGWNIFQDPVSPGSIDITLERCLVLTRAYYSSLMNTHLATRNYPNSDPPESIDKAYTSQSISLYDVFWRDLRSAIYLLKPDPILGQSSDHHAFPLFKRVGNIVSHVCAQQPLALLKDIFLYVSPANWSVWSIGRACLLRLFQDGLDTQDALQKVLWQLLNYLWETDGNSREFYRTLMSLMLDDAARILPRDHPEMFQLRLAYVKFLRQSGDYANAQSKCSSLIASAEFHFGKNSSSTRRAMSEMVYIHSRQNNLQLAEDVATEVIYRGHQYLGSSPPTAQYIYSMEDIAEVLEKQKGYHKVRQSRQYLEDAYVYAVRFWGPEQTPTKHIFEKLEVLRNREAQMNQPIFSSI